jgi:ParB family chromosome partitioning protein
MKMKSLDEHVDDIHNKIQVSDEIFEIPLDLIDPDPEQPRQQFDEDELLALGESLDRDGQLQPIITRRNNGRYLIIAGERRYRASILKGKDTIKAIIRDVDDEKKIRLQLVENLHRQDLNPIEEAIAYKKFADKGFTHKEISEEVGKSRTYVTNKLRLLKLPPEIQKQIQEGKIGEGHARTLLSLDPVKREENLRRIKADNLSVRAAEELLRDVTRETPREIESRLIIANRLHIVKVLIGPDGSIKSSIEPGPLVDALVDDLKMLQEENLN